MQTIRYVKAQSGALIKGTMNPEDKIEMSEILAAYLAQLEPFAACLHGNRLANILVIKGQKGQAEADGQAPFFGSDGTALESAFSALGWGNNSWCGVLLEPLGQPALNPEQLRLLIEIVDPVAVVALDLAAVDAVQEAYGPNLLSKKLAVNKKSDALGRPIICLDGFEAALQDPHLKQIAWAQLKTLKK